MDPEKKISNKFVSVGGVQKLSRLSMASLCGNVHKRSQTLKIDHGQKMRTRLYHVYNTVRQYFELYRPFDLTKLDKRTDRKRS